MFRSVRLDIGAAGETRVRIDLDTLLETRLLLTASSGGGKSGAIFELCEQAVAHVPIFLLDAEGEFAALRAQFPFILAGPEGETPAHPHSAALLAHRLLELGASAICDLYELPRQQRHEFVRNFLQAMIDAPKKLWRPVIVIVDEAHVFAPEKGSGESVASEAVIDMATRGRKRGFCMVLATQRLAMLSKTAAANCQNVLLGRTSQIDQARATDTLHITHSVTKVELWRELSRMRTGEFYAYGMAFGTETPLRFQVDRARTLPEKKDKLNFHPPPAPAAIQALLPKLADIPKEAEQKIRNEQELRTEIRTLKQQIVSLQKNSPATADEVAMLQQKVQELGSAIARLEQQNSDYRQTLQEIAGLIAERIAETPQTPAPKRVALETVPFDKKTGRQLTPSKSIAQPDSNGALPKGERMVMTCIAQTNPDREQITAITGFKRSTRDAYLARLRGKDYIRETDGAFQITALGATALGPFEELPSGTALRDYWLARLPKGEDAVLSALTANPHANVLSRDQIGEATGYKRSTRDAYIARLVQKKLVLLEGSGVRASPLLFD